MPINEAKILDKVELMEAHLESARQLAIDIKKNFAPKVPAKKRGLTEKQKSDLIAKFEKRFNY